MTLEPLAPPPTLNYIGVFLTLGCNLNCAYCINDPQQSAGRKALFPLQAPEMSPDYWIKALERLPARADLPITLQGGEPSLYWRGKGLGDLLAGLGNSFDLLTNMTLPADVFAAGLKDQQEKLRRAAPYPSIRVSYHADEMEKLWRGRGFERLVENCLALGEHGFTVTPDKATSDVGIYVVDHPDNHISDEMRDAVAGRLPLEMKPFLGVHEETLHGDYLYPYSTDLIARGFAEKTLNVECRTTELLIDPLGFIWGCHFHLYETWRRGAPALAFASLEQHEFRFSEHGRALFEGKPLTPVGHILDPEFSLDHLQTFRSCAFYGRCIGCDTKIKNDRFQSLDDRQNPHTSVEIREIDMPAHLLHKLSEREQAALEPVLVRRKVA
jgi:hypothetical protein